MAILASKAINVCHTIASKECVVLKKALAFAVRIVLAPQALSVYQILTALMVYAKINQTQ